MSARRILERKYVPRVQSLADKVWDVDNRTITFSDIGGLDEVKNQIKRRIILPFKKPSLFQKFRKKAGGGMLL